MATFGNLIQSKKPVLLSFYDSENAEQIETLKKSLHEVVGVVKTGAKVVKIDAQRNKALLEALKIQHLPSFMVYKNDELLWKADGNQAVKTLIAVLQKTA